MNTVKPKRECRCLSRRNLMCWAAAGVATTLCAGGSESFLSRLGAEEPGHAQAVPIQQGKGHPFVCTDYSGAKVFIVTAEGKAEWEYPAEACNDLWILPSGNLLFNTGHGVREVTRDKKVVFDYQSKSEIYACQRLPNGNTVLTNWVGHGHFGKAPHIIEVTADKKVVWTFNDHKTMKTISNIQLLDVPGDAVKGEIIH